MKARILPGVIFAVVTLVAVLGAAACTDTQDPDSNRPPTPTETDPLTTGSETEKIEASVKALLEAVQQRDLERVRAVLSESLRQLAPEAQAEMLTDCIPAGTAVQPIGADVEAFGKFASTSLSLRAIKGADVTVVEWHWDFERQDDDGRWALSQLPECPWPKS